VLRRDLINETCQLRIDTLRVPPFNFVNPLKDGWSEEILEQENDQGENDRETGWEVEKDYNCHPNREKQAEQ
jgi:hypothetical protein